jgi:hypothetical protein
MASKYIDEGQTKATPEQAKQAYLDLVQGDSHEYIRSQIGYSPEEYQALISDPNISQARSTMEQSAHAITPLAPGQTSEPTKYNTQTTLAPDMRVQQPGETTDAYNTRIGNVPTPGAYNSMQDLLNAGFNTNGKSPTIVTSEPARNLYNQNLSYLGSSTVNAPTPYDAFGNPVGSPESKKTNQQTGQVGQGSTPPPISLKSANQALNSITETANGILQQYLAQGGQLTPEMQTNIAKINSYGNAQITAQADAINAAKTGNPKLLQEATTAMKAAEDAGTKAVKEMMPKLQELEAQRLASMQPSAKQQALEQGLVDIKSKIADKLRSFEAGMDKVMNQTIPMEAIIGQGKVLNEQALREVRAFTDYQANLLDELGLEDKAQELRTQTIDQQIGYLRDDADLQQKLQDRIDQRDARLADEARNLRTESLNGLRTILDTFQGVSYDDLDAQGKAQLSQYANQFGVPLNLLIEGMSNNKAQLVLDNAGKAANTARTNQLTTNGGNGDPTTDPTKLNSPDKIRDYLQRLKTANPNENYYDVWGTAADYLKSIGLTPANYDSIFWEVLHPEGTAGYKKYKEDQGGDINFLTPGK